jgi:hypothetical protein
MAKLPQTGVAYQCLYGYDCTLSEVMASLGLRPLSKKAEGELRFRLGVALALWEEPYAAIQVKDVVTSLNSHAKRLDEIGPLAAITRERFARGDEIAVSGELVQVLTSDPTIESVEAARAYLSEFCDRARKIASACRAAASSLQSTKGKDGKPPYHWYDEFTAVLVDICKQNKIEPTVGIDRISGEPVGDLFEVASGFERLLAPKMRSPAPAALVKRLQRSLGRLEDRTQSASRRSTSRGEHPLKAGRTR